MKKRLVLVLGIILVLLITACGQEPAGKEENTETIGETTVTESAEETDKSSSEKQGEAMNDNSSDISLFKPSDVSVQVSENGCLAINNFVQENGDILYQWYLNEIADEFETINVLKSDSWTKDRHYEFEIPDTSKEYILIAYVKSENSDDRVSRIVACIREDNENCVLDGDPIDAFSSSHIEYSAEDMKVTLTNSFNPYGPQLYTWYVYQGDLNNCVFKSDGWYPENSFEYVPEIEGDYYFVAYVRDALDERSKVEIGPIHVR